MSNNNTPIERTPLGWLVNLLYIMSQSMDILVEDIDYQLRLQGEHFKKEQKRAFNTYTRKQREAAYWMHDVIKIDDAFWEATDRNSRRYSNSVADAHELLRATLLYMDRSHTEKGYYQIMRFLRGLPQGGIFPEKTISRFEFNRAWVYERGDRVHNENHGDGSLDLDLGNGNWQVALDSGGKVILNESTFKLI
jgi:hypothetical protein